MGKPANHWPCGRGPGSWGTRIREMGHTWAHTYTHRYMSTHIPHMQIYIHTCMHTVYMHTLEEEEEEERRGGGARQLLLGRPIAKKTPNPQRVLDHAL